MSLLVWLPLTGNINNQGLASSLTTTNTPVYKTTGKIGSCLDLNTRVRFSCPDLNNIQTFSIAFWAKVNADTSLTTNWVDVIGFTDVHTNGTTGQLRWETCYGSGYENRGISGHDNATYATTNGPNGAATAGGKGVWNHIVCTVENGVEVKEYRDGVLSGTYSSNGGHLNGTFWLGETGKVNGEINDVRIYDEVLSPLEVKRLSQALVLHYPLNRQGWGQDNLMPNSIEMPLGSSSVTTGTWRIAGLSAMTRSRVAITDSPVGNSAYGFQSVGLQTNADASCWGIDSFPKDNGETYTISAWGRIVGGSTTAAMLGFSLYNATTIDYGGTYGKALSSDTEYYGSGAYDYAGGKLNPSGTWTRIYRTFTSTAASGNIYVGFNTAKTGNNVTVQVCGVKLEKGDKMTTWTPNSAETAYTTMGLNGITEYDTSGFCNNGTRTGTFSWTSDTPKYQVSTYFNGSSYIVTDYYFTLGTDNFTIAAWAKIELNSSKTYQPIIINKDTRAVSVGCGIYFNHNQNKFLWSTADGSAATEVWTANTFSDIYDKWVHVVMVRDSNDAKKGCFYINGIREELTSTPAIRDVTNNIYPMVIGAIGPHNYPTYQYTGNLSDVRIYATALSADDVKSLYQNCAIIDADGTIHGQIRS